MAWIASAALAAVLAVGASPLATPVPDEVLDALGCTAPAGGDVGEEACAGASLEAPRAVHAWSDGFLSVGPADGTWLAETHEWIAIRFDADRAVIGTALVWEPTEGEYELAGFDNDVVLGELLLASGTTDPAAALVHDAPSGAWYTVADDVVTPLNDWAEGIVPAPTPLPEARRLIVAEHQAPVAACGGEPTCAGGAGGDDIQVGADTTGGPQLPVILATGGGIAAALVIALAVTALVQRRRQA